MTCGRGRNLFGEVGKLPCLCLRPVLPSSRDGFVSQELALAFNVLANEVGEVYIAMLGEYLWTGVNRQLQRFALCDHNRQYTA